MSKAFTSEETPDEPVLGRPVTRAARGQERPMTPEGYKALVAEQQALTAARPLEKDPPKRASLDHRLALVTATLESVRVVEPPPVDGTVRFGSEVTLEWEDGKTQTVRLVGPDEADGKDGRISIESPLARTLLEQHEGDEVEVIRPRGIATATLVSVR
jgi:transcription elongation factor GreB